MAFPYSYSPLQKPSNDVIYRNTRFAANLLTGNLFRPEMIQSIQILW